MIDDLGAHARRVLLRNWRGGSTVPSRSLYPHQWSWDSAFIAVGLRHVSPRRAQRELESLFGAQWADGRVPQIVFDPATPPDAYFPSGDFWRPGRAAATSALVQPPVHALAALAVHRADPASARRRGFLPRLYPKLCAWHDYLRVRRDLGGRGLVSVVHPWESGMDNSPSWDGPLSRITPAEPGTYRRRDLGAASGAERPTDRDYGRYVTLAARYRDAGFADTLAVHRFAVEDPLTNGLLAASDAALAEIALLVGADPGPHRERAARLTEAMVAELYDPGAGIFFARDVHTRELVREHTVGGLAPLVVPGLPVAGELVKTALGERFRLGEIAPVPSYDLLGAGFEPARYWRGPAWFNTGWLVWRGLLEHGETGHADQLRAGMLAAVRHAGFREYLDPFTGAGHGADEFSWTAAVVVDLIEAGPASAVR